MAAIVAISVAELLVAAGSVLVGVGSVLFLSNKVRHKPAKKLADGETGQCPPHDWNNNPKDFEDLCTSLDIDSKATAGKIVHELKVHFKDHPHVCICASCGAISSSGDDDDIIGSLR